MPKLNCTIENRPMPAFHWLIRRSRHRNSPWLQLYLYIFVKGCYTFILNFWWQTQGSSVFKWPIKTYNTLKKQWTKIAVINLIGCTVEILFLGCNAVWSFRWIPTFRRIMQSPHSALKTNISTFTTVRTSNRVRVYGLCSTDSVQGSTEWGCGNDKELLGFANTFQ
jgi:hypothetical protein